MNATPSINLPEILPLWPEGGIPRASPDDGTLPRLTYYLPSDEFRTGQTMLVLPGGGYGNLSSPKEGHRPAQMLASKGIAAGVLEYRHAPSRHPVPLIDAQRAIRILRAKANENALRTDAVGCMGFSAGGHLAGSLATQPDEECGQAGDEFDAISCKPDFAALIYPVVSLVEAFAHQGSAKNLLGDSPNPRLADKLSIEKAVTGKSPPTFLAHGQNDNAVPVENAIQLYRALTACKVPSVMHLYADMPHGIGLGSNHPWGNALLEWLDSLADEDYGRQ